MCRRIIRRGHTVDPGRDNLSVPDHHRTKGAARSTAHIFCGQPDGQLHEVILRLHVHPSSAISLALSTGLPEYPKDVYKRQPTRVTEIAAAAAA